MNNNRRLQYIGFIAEAIKVQLWLFGCNNIDKVIKRLGQPDAKQRPNANVNDIIRLALDNKLPDKYVFTEIEHPPGHNVEMVYNWYSKFKFITLVVDECNDGSIRKSFSSK